jgi:hypothetical protein
MSAHGDARPPAISWDQSIESVACIESAASSVSLFLCLRRLVGLLLVEWFGVSRMLEGGVFVWTKVQPIESGLDGDGMLGAAVRFAKTHSCGEAA